MSKQHSIKEMQTQIRQLKTTIALPGVPADEIAIYQATIQRIQAEINARQAQPVTPTPTPPPTEQIKHNTPPLPAEAQAKAGNQQPATSNQQPLKTIHAGNQHPVNSRQPMSATIQADHHTDPHNPTVTITWADGYTYTGDETAIRGRFTTTLRDTLALRLVQQGRFNAMWRWSSPWRAAGFYQALTYIIGGAPTIHELGISRPNELTRNVFQLIAEKSFQPNEIG